MKKVALVTGSAGLIGSETSRRFASEGFDVVGIDNDMRAVFFGDDASTERTRRELESTLTGYTHHDVDVRDQEAVGSIFAEHNQRIAVVIHTAAQPSHDWAARDPRTDFDVNALGTMNLLEATRTHCPEAPFIFTSTNKVYGDSPNRLPLVEKPTRWEIAADHKFAAGIDESMSIDHSLHSLFGVSKVAADVMVQEYGRYFDMPTVCFRGGCLTGPKHAGAELHGFLAYLMKCTTQGTPYRVFGYGGKQVRDNIHSADLVSAFWAFYQSPRKAAVYNIGGSRHSHCSMLEAIELCQEIAQVELDWTYVEEQRRGDHMWWVSDVRRFQQDYPRWSYAYDLRAILEQIHDGCVAAG